MVRDNSRFNTRSQVRRANFVLNNPNNAERAWLASLTSRATRNIFKIRFIIFQEEIAPDTATHHIQGYCEFQDRVRPLGRLMKQTSSPWTRFHWTKVDFPKAAIKYASKEETRMQGGLNGKFGEAAANRDQTVTDVTDQILSGVILSEVINQHPDISFMHYEKIVDFHNRQVPERFGCNVILLIGPSGCGKSWWAAEAAKSKGTTYFVPDRTRHNGRWDWKSYSSENSIVINEFDDRWLKVVSFKQFFDIFPYQVEAKGQNMSFKTNNIYLTTNNDIKNWYKKFRSNPENAVHTNAMERRITQFFKIYDCRANSNWMAPIDDDSEITGATEPFMIMTLRPHPVGGFKFADLQTTFGDVPPTFRYEGQRNRDGLDANDPYGGHY